jgi:hypothetical protein
LTPQPPDVSSELAGARAIAVAAAAIALGHALRYSNGALHPAALQWLTVVIVLAMAALLAPPLPRIDRRVGGWLVLVVGMGLAFQMGSHLTDPPGVQLRASAAGYARHHLWIALGAVVAGGALSERPWSGRWSVPLLLGVHFVLGLWLLEASPNPNIDVTVWHREALQALGAGQNPYALTMPNIYGHTDWYAPGLADAARVHVGYPYPPLSLLLAAPGHWLFGDYRYANLLALTASGWLLAYARPSGLSRGAAALFLFTPRMFFVLEQGWTEALAVLAMAAVVFCACRAPRSLPYAFGALLATKQYFVLLAPVAFLLAGSPFEWRSQLRFLGKAVATAAVLTLPFIVWNPAAFFRSVVMFQALQPFRPDALSYLAATAEHGTPLLPQWINFGAAAVAIGLGAWRAPRTPAGFALTAAVAFLLFFAFAKQAFCNYYFLIVGILCCALATAARPARGALR